MKKYEQDILGYIVPVIGSMVYLTFFGPEISWSENALKAFNSLLNAGLAGMMAIFLIEAYNHPKRNDEIYKWAAKPIRFRTLCKFTAWGFFSIIVFSLNTFLPEWLHMVATGAAVTGLFLMVVGRFKTWSLNWWIFTPSIILATMFLVVAFAFRTIDVKYPEFFLMVIGLCFLYKIR